ncbi:MAG: glycosyltransferase family 9 protein [Firmicutes bacterium]|nr:glycosyltransferase family 9 protein [Bacillota bacterium]
MKILVINLMPAIGELLFVTPAFKVIRQAFPEATIDVLIAEDVRQLCLYNRNLDKIISFDKKRGQAGIIAHFKLIREIRKYRYDLVINLNPSERASLIAALSRGKKICGFATKSFKLFFNPYLVKDRSIHSADCYLKALREIGIPNIGDNKLEMEYDRQSQAIADRIWLENNFQNQTIVGVHPGANWPSKRWKPEYLAKLSDMLQQDGIKMVFFGGPSDIEIVEKVASLTKIQPVILTGKLNLLELAAVIKKCSVFLSGDSGPMHIAVSQQVPVVALFGPTRPARYGPYHSPHIVIEPDNNILANEDKKKLMEYITPGQVYQGIYSLLKNQI